MALNAAVSLVVALPLIPLRVLGDTPVPVMNQVVRDSVGWPVYVRQIAAAYQAVPAADRRRAVIVTSNYGEAGAVDHYGVRYHLPAVYSGHNQLYYQGRPPSSASVVVFVGGQLDRARGLFRSCGVVGHLDNEVGVDNEEQGEPISICRDPVGGWSGTWAALRHED